ncbi:uncharacterized protein N7503_003846 [Penicillium pulvis]|uniref:uncharacterized protein n=1 Tax=Penicillium pulvis TaxID=1562058 RepID=UPI0025487246|nr:uncharacterized protein N7503_003846 [Penicillium pulvis]KAJ5806244.1 hypothetical protein N7503_003846 [Penicillium pulvis]
MSLTPKQNQAIEITERITSGLSICGALFVILTYSASSSFHKPVNRMVFYASWGNILANVSTMISLSGISAGRNSVMCQSQGFLIQMFMPADALWTLAMACNVYLTFRHRYSSSQLRGLEWKWLLACYGIPFIPAITYAFLRTEEKGRIYGPATLWCWVDLQWDPLRIATFYAPVWMIFLVTSFIYLSVGTEIYKKRKHLRSMASRSLDTVQSMKRVEVQITTEIAGESCEVGQDGKFSQYAAFVSSAEHTNANTSNALKSTPKMSSSDAAAWAYTKCAMLFFAALLITWVPSTINRVYTLIAEGKDNFALCYFEALVLPLQGFWNCIIYITTSLGACRKLWASLFTHRPISQRIALSNMDRERNFSRIEEASESTKDLAPSSPGEF